MKITGNQWVEIIRAISTAIIAIITTLCVQSCTMSLSVSKNNQNSTQKTEQTTKSSVDSTKRRTHPNQSNRTMLHNVHMLNNTTHRLRTG